LHVDGGDSGAGRADTEPRMLRSHDGLGPAILARQTAKDKPLLSFCIRNENFLISFANAYMPTQGKHRQRHRETRSRPESPATGERSDIQGERVTDDHRLPHQRRE
jgi:hypothetical protein